MTMYVKWRFSFIGLFSFALVILLYICIRDYYESYSTYPSRQGLVSYDNLHHFNKMQYIYNQLSRNYTSGIETKYFTLRCFKVGRSLSENRALLIGETMDAAYEYFAKQLTFVDLPSTPIKCYLIDDAYAPMLTASMGTTAFTFMPLEKSFTVPGYYGDYMFRGYMAPACHELLHVLLADSYASIVKDDKAVSYQQYHDRLHNIIYEWANYAETQVNEDGDWCAEWELTNPHLLIQEKWKNALWDFINGDWKRFTGVYHRPVRCVRIKYCFSISW